MSDAAGGDLIAELEASAGWHAWKRRATGSSRASPADGHHRALISADSVENL